MASGTESWLEQSWYRRCHASEFDGKRGLHLLNLCYWPTCQTFGVRIGLDDAQQPPALSAGTESCQPVDPEDIAFAELVAEAEAIGDWNT